MYKDKIKACTFLLKRVMSDLNKEFDKKKEKGRVRVAKGLFGPTFNRVRDNKDSIKRKALSSRKRERVIIIYQKCIICERPVCKNLKACYYAFLETALKGGAPLALT